MRYRKSMAVPHIVFLSYSTVLSALFVLLLTAQAVRAESFTVFASNNPPFNYQAEDGSVQGIAVDVLKLLMERAHQPIAQDDITTLNWARAMDLTEYEPNHILLSPARTPNRELSFAWVGPLHPLKLGLVAHKRQHLTPAAPNELQQCQIGVIRDSAPMHILQEQFEVPEENLTILANDEQLFKMLLRGRVEAIPRGRLAASYWLDRLHQRTADFEFIYTLKELDLYIAFSPMTDPQLIHRLNRELKQLKQPRPDGTSEYQEIVDRHMRGGLIPLH